jgi:acyl-coenzyme A thioesterase PaaI-like protein
MERDVAQGRLTRGGAHTILQAMMPTLPTGRALRTLWSALRPVPGGRAAFGGLFRLMVPYSATICPEFLDLEPGFARVRMRDRRAVRNHLESVHAIALMNLAELTSGMALMNGLPDDARAIITHLSMEYLKKARGTLTAQCSCDVPSSNEKAEKHIEAEIRDGAGDIVARGRARWLIGPLQPRK